jgi:hypothetical protein
VKTAVLTLVLYCSVGRTESIKGSVKDDAGAPLWNAIVDLKREPNVEVASARADSTGTFQFAGIEPGKYGIVIQAEGFVPRVLRDVNVTSSHDPTLDAVTLKLRLPNSPLDIAKVDQRFRIGSVRIDRIWTSSRGLASVPSTLLESAWKEQGISLASGSQTDSVVIYRAKDLIERVFAKYGSPVRVLVEMDPRPENPMAPVNALTAITFRVIERCECR